MTTFTINNPVFESKYTAYEMKLKFINFLEKELKEDSVELFEISVDDLSKKSKDRLANIDKLNFINY